MPTTPPPYTPRTRSVLCGHPLVAVSAVAAAVMLAGCATSTIPHTPSAAQTPNPLTLTADDNDLDAGVEVGAGQAEAVIVGKPVVSPDTRTRTYRLKHITGLEGELVIARTKDTPNGEGATFTMACHMGVVGDAGLERRILERVRVRLTDLKGVEFAKIRTP